MRYLIMTLSLCLAATAYAGKYHDGKPHHGKHHGYLFKKADTDNDGNVSIDEHEEALERMVEHRREMFKRMDTNNDGLVSKTEAAEAHRENRKHH